MRSKDLHVFRYLTQEAKRKNVSAHFLDPRAMTFSVIEYDRHAARSYVEKALSLSNFAQKEFVMFSCNTGGHWIAVIISMKWHTVWYLDSIYAKDYNHSILTAVIDEAYSNFIQNDPRRKRGKSALQHMLKFLCHQQPLGHACGFYAFYHMLNAISAISSLNNPKEFSVPTVPLDRTVLFNLRERIAMFLMSEVISEKGEFHSHDGTY